MAIKSISQLDRFDNEGNDQGSFSIGGKLAFLSSDETAQETTGKGTYYNFLTDSDRNCYLAPTRIKGSGTTTIQDVRKTSNNSYWSSLFEISKPIEYSTTDAALEYESQSITYEKLMENIIWDTKSYLNARNNLNDYDLLSVIQRDYYFDGNKTFNNNVSVAQNLSVQGKLTCDGDALFKSNVNVDKNVDVKVNVDVGGNVDVGNNVSIGQNLTVNNTTKTNNLSVRNSLTVDCNISCSTPNLIFDGWSYGLIDRINDKATNVKTNCGTYNDKITDGLFKQPDRTGDPVCFKDGRPYELTAVNYAMSAYNLVSETGPWNVGNGEIRKVTGITTSTDSTSTYKAVYFSNGIPLATNVIDFAEHAYWSDLGERYLADDVYEPGTLVKFGGEKEITIADDEVNAIVSTKAFDLNAGLVDGTVIALCGRVPTKVKGKIEKFDKIMLSDIPGVACKWDGASRVIGRALESNTDEDIKLVECVTRFEI